jgi:tetratricopeptide (TPR) repeat protein
MPAGLRNPVNRFFGLFASGLLAASFLPAISAAQSSDTAAKAPDPSETLKGHQGTTLRISVVDDDGKPLERQALVKLHSRLQDTTDWQTTAGASQTTFDDQLFGQYDIEASALGYLTGRTAVDIASITILDIKVVLKRDPSVRLDAGDAAQPPKLLHETNKAVRSLNSGDLKDAEKRLEEADKTWPSNPHVKFLLGYTYFAKHDYEQAQATLRQAIALNPHDSRALTLLGRIQLLQAHYQDAATTLEQAVADDSTNWVAHDLLADAYLQQQDYDNARRQALLAIEHGEADGSVAQLPLAQALAAVHKNAEAADALRTFLSAHPKSPAAPHAQALLKTLEEYKGKSSDQANAAIEQAASFQVSTDVLTSAKADLPAISWLPANVDRNMPPVVSGLSCPSDQVIQGAGASVEELVTNVEKFAAIENIEYQRLDEAGNSSYDESFKFDYAAAISQKPDVVLVDEYRTQRYDVATLPDRIVDNGFAALALVFHPTMRDAFKMTCEGLGEWHGKPTWLVRFQQRDDRANHMQAYLVGTLRFPVSLKGRAWITADKFQIVRIVSDMVRPMPQIDLQAEHVVTEYAPVQLHKKSLEFWLPQSAEVYMHFRGQRYYRKHTFDKYMLFSVDATDKTHEAKQDPDTNVPKSTNPKKHKFWPV